MTPCPPLGLQRSQESRAARHAKGELSLLANTIAHQWWGVSVSPASRDDWGSAMVSHVIQRPLCRASAGAAGLEEVVKDM